MGLLVSDDIGLIKTTTLNMSDGEIISNESGVGLAVKRMCWLSCQADRLAVSRANGVIDFFELNEEKWTKVKSFETEAEINLMSWSDNTLLVITDTSILRFSSEDYERKSCDTLPGGPYTLSILLDDDHALVSKGSSPPVVFNLTTLRIIWSGKNAPDTPLALSSIFTTESAVALSPTVFVCGSLEGKLRLYHIDKQRKPLLELVVQEAYQLSGNYTGTTGPSRPIKVLTLSEDRSTLFAGDTFGSVIGLNIKKLVDQSFKIEAKVGTRAHADMARKTMPLMCSVNGVTGSVRCIQVHESTLFIATAGRYLYAYDVKTKRVAKKSFNQKLTYCLPFTAENTKRARLS